MDVLAILTSLGLLIVLAYRGYSVIVIAPLLALLAVLLSGELTLLGMYTQVFMRGLGNFIIKYFPIFLLGAIFGKLMDASGAARAIAAWFTRRLGTRHAVTAIVLSCAVLTYGGVAVFIVAFAVFPLARELFRAADIPRRLIPGTIALGAFTFSMTALPGTAQIHNVIPMPYFRTDAFAAPVFGLLAAALILGLGLTWLQFRVGQARRCGEPYGTSGAPSVEKPRPLPPFGWAVLPVGLVIGLNFVFANYVIPAWNTDYLAEATFGNTSLDSVKGLWAMICAMLVAIGVLLLTLRRYLAQPQQLVTEGANGALLPIFNTASEVGYGASIAALAGFETVKQFVLGLFEGEPLLGAAVAVNLLAGITGSASGGLAIALETLGARYYELAQAQQISPELMHRVAAMASGGFDSLPHNGAVITLLMICRLTHRESYADIAVSTLLIPVSVLFGLILLFS